jgi:hypothetical protein
MHEHEWADKLQKRKVREFAFFPHAYTPMEKEKSLVLPDVEVELGGEEETQGEGAQTDSTPSWIKNLSFTIAGVTIGGAAVYGLLGMTQAPAPACPAPITNQQPVQPTVVQPTQPTPGGAPRSTPAATPASTASTTTTDAAATTTPGSADGTTP